MSSYSHDSDWFWTWFVTWSGPVGWEGKVCWEPCAKCALLRKRPKKRWLLSVCGLHCVRMSGWELLQLSSKDEERQPAAKPTTENGRVERMGPGSLLLSLWINHLCCLSSQSLQLFWIISLSINSAGESQGFVLKEDKGILTGTLASCLQVCAPSFHMTPDARVVPLDANLTRLPPARGSHCPQGKVPGPWQNIQRPPWQPPASTAKSALSP